MRLAVRNLILAKVYSEVQSTKNWKEDANLIPCTFHFDNSPHGADVNVSEQSENEIFKTFMYENLQTIIMRRNMYNAVTC
jgi:hypothetical protein